MTDLIVFLALCLALLGARALGNFSEGRHATCEIKAPWMVYGGGYVRLVTSATFFPTLIAL